METYLITGGAGFIGSHLVKKLLSENFKVIVVDNFDDFYDYKIKISNLCEATNSSFQIKYDKKEKNLKEFVDFINNADKNMILLNKDIRNFDDLKEIFKNYKFDGIVHLAAKAGVRPSFERPLDYEETNIKGTLNLLELCKKFKINNFVCASSSSVYGDTPKLPFSESDNIKKTLSPYALTKKTCEEMAYLYYKNYGIKVIMLRFFTVYGPGQRPDLAIHKFAGKLKYNEKISIYGDGKTGRDYTYIDDIIAGITASIKFINKKNECYEIFNLGNNRVITLMEMVKIMEKISGYKADLEFCDFQKGDMPMTYADISKAKKLLGYSPKTDFEDGIEKFFEWFEKKEESKQNVDFFIFDISILRKNFLWTVYKLKKI